jgi:hypothetical protein
MSRVAGLSRIIGAHLDEFSACSDAEPVTGSVLCVSVLVAPRGILLVVHMPNDRHRDQTDGDAEDYSRSYQSFHFHPSSRWQLRKR